MKRIEYLQQIKTEQVLQAAFFESSMIKTADEGALSSVISGITSHIKEQYDENHPVESILAFLAPGVLWTFGFRWVAIIFQLAAALGWDWSAFFASLREKLKPLITDLSNGVQRQASEVHSAVEESASSSFTGEMDPGKVLDLATKASKKEILFIVKIAKDNDQTLIEKMLRAGTGNRFKKGITGFIIRIFSWALTSILAALFFSLAGAGVSKMLGIKKEKHTDPEQVKQQETEADHKKVELKLNPQASQELLQEHSNSKSNVWVLDVPLANIKLQLITWAQELYPQLADDTVFAKSSYYNNTVKLFQDRNKGNKDLGAIAVPSIFSSIKEIVDSFAADVALKTS